MVHSRDILRLALLAALLMGGAPPRRKAPATPPAAPNAAGPRPEAGTSALAQARTLFEQGVDEVRRAQWANALAAFERSATLKPHATTTFNIAACERAMGLYTRARLDFSSALARNAAHPGELAPSLQVEAKGFVAEIDRLLAHVNVTLDPASAAISVDGRPLEPLQKGSANVFVGGIAAPGRGRVLGPSKFRMDLDPGAHVIILSRKGYTDALVNRSFAPGSTTSLDLVLARLPATLDVSSNVAGAIVTVNQHDLGPVPVQVLRPAGTYHVGVRKDGYEPYAARVTVQAGEQSNLRARLVVETIPITKRWWFWTAATVVVAGGALATYALTRPSPQPPPYDGGTTGWVVNASSFRF